MARERGVVPPDVARTLLAADRKAAAADRKAATAAAELHAAVAAAHQAGASIRELAALLGRSTNTIQAWVRAAAAEGS